tara:strand:+ start:519 stop:926 length:408 start_codon:yes stop_codon:yes gene_type:complete
MTKITGNCLCGDISYEISQTVGDIVHCHCIKCRKAHGAAFSSVAKIEDQNFLLRDESQYLKSYESSEGKYRHFCSNCGSQIYAKRDNTDFIILRLGTLNDESMAGSQYQETKHIWLAEKACWYETNSSLEEHQEL